MADPAQCRIRTIGPIHIVNGFSPMNIFTRRYWTAFVLLGVTAFSGVALADTPSYTPLYPAGTPVTEQIQYREADGTLVTRMGMRPVGRHAREPWDNKAEDAGLYYLYPSFYFQNRTY